MAEDLTIIQGSKPELYESILPQVNALIEGEPDLIANLANIAAALKEQFGLAAGIAHHEPDLGLLAALLRRQVGDVETRGPAAADAQYI